MEAKSRSNQSPARGLLYPESENAISCGNSQWISSVEDLLGRGSVPSHLPFLLIVLVTFVCFPVEALSGQASQDSQLDAPVQTAGHASQQTTQACLTPSPADASTIPMQAASTNGTIAGHVVPKVRAGKALQKGRMPSNFSLHIELVFKLRNPDQFSRCLDSINDPSSPDYRHFLNMTMLQPYLPTPGQKASLVSFLSRMGLVVTEGPSPLVLELSGPIKVVEKVFGVKINVYAEKAKVNFYAPSSDPMMPQNFASIVNGIQGLNNYTRPMPAQYPCSGPYCPQGIQAGYSFSTLFGNGYDGTGQKVAIVDVPGDPNIQSAIDTFSTRYGLPLTTINIQTPEGPPSTYDPGWASETAMDVEAVHTVAPRATIVLLYDENPMYAIDWLATWGSFLHLPSIVSNSWSYACGLDLPCSDTQLSPADVSNTHSRLAFDVAQGLTILFASGDDGAKPDGTNVGTEFPASDPNVLAVGGTNLVLSGCDSTTCSGYGSETGWVWSGGGYSGYFPEPSWQTSVIGTRPGRAVPDISMLGGSPGFWVYSTISEATNSNPYACGTPTGAAGWYGCTGTSLSTPLWAGFMAIVLQMKGGGLVGNLGPTLYKTANSPSYPSDFHDVTSGSNGYYSAGSGWDPVTGWGTPIASLLAPALAGAIGTLNVSLIAPPNGATLTTSPVTFQVQVTDSTGAPIQGALGGITVNHLSEFFACGISGSDSNGYFSCDFTFTDGGTYSWYATASKMGYVPATSQTWTFTYYVTVTTTMTTTQISTLSAYGTTTTTVTSYTSTATSTSTIPTVTTVVLVPLTITSTEQSTQFLTSFLTTTVTDYTSTTTSTSTIPTTVALVPLTMTSTAQSTQYLTSILTTTVTNYTGTETSTSTILVPTTIVLVPLTATSTEQSTQYLTSTATKTVTIYTDTQTVTSTIPTVTTVVLLPSTVTSTIQATQYLTSILTTTVTNYTSTTTSTSTSVVYTTVTTSPGGAGPAGAGASSSTAYPAFITVLAITIGHRVTAGRPKRVPKARAVSLPVQSYSSSR